MSYELSSGINLLSEIGREFHFGNQSLIPLDEATFSPSGETITLAHSDTYFISTGIAYNLTNKFSLEARYRYATRSLFTASDYSIRSNKFSLSLRYNI